MSQPAFSNVAGKTKQIVLNQTPVKLGTGVAGAPLANRNMWRARCDDVDNIVLVAYAAADLPANGFALLAGIPELRSDGPAIDIWGVAATGSPTVYVSEEA